ncbi:HNH endonuclease [Thiothrix nivea]|uniref:HNH endonuclease n=1 Tax=Thiothrix nivea TaxID=1031 RepID=UPI00145C6340
MSITAETRLLVRERAGFACEFCGVTETDTAAELTVDHYQPQAKGGSDDPDNLIYSCTKCNAFKSDYWPDSDVQPVLWNPRIELQTCI